MGMDLLRLKSVTLVQTTQKFVSLFLYIKEPFMSPKTQ